MSRTLLRVAFVTALAAGGIAVSSGGATGADAQSATFECTGGAQSWVVPANVTSATFDVVGAQGGVGDDGQLDRPSAPAGLGGHTTATIAVTPGETIQINVGCAGSDSLGNAGAPGGFGGSSGGDGGVGGDLGTGGGGGGSSDVRQGGTGLANRAVVAGGGGGSGGANGVDVSAAATEVGGGGDGGGLAGDPGIDTANAGGGQGGTQSANGAGTSVNSCGDPIPGNVGGDGTDGAGGAGGDGKNFGAGGGGGGGYHSGGGGEGCVNGGGGGGGAGFALATATGVSQAVGVQSGDGRVVVTFTPGTPAPAAVTASPRFTG